MDGPLMKKEEVYGLRSDDTEIPMEVSCHHLFYLFFILYN